MKIYIVSEGALNTGYESRIKCICASEELANHIAKSFIEYCLIVTEFDVIQ